LSYTSIFKELCNLRKLFSMSIANGLIFYKKSKKQIHII